MKTLHIVQGGVKNGDKRLLERVAATKTRIPTWIAPKAAAPGDEVVIFVGGYGFFATGRVASAARPRPDSSRESAFGHASRELAKAAGCGKKNQAIDQSVRFRTGVEKLKDQGKKI